MDRPVVIVGAGLSGLRSASLLTSRGVRCLVLEARNRIGGRAFSEQIADRPELGWFDLGPTWFWPDFQPTISRLVDEFGLSTITQCTEGAMLVERSSHTSAQRLRLPANSLPTSIRLVGGIRSLIDAVAKTLPSGTIKLGARVTGIAKNAGQILVRWTDQHGYVHEDKARTAILALPPRIVARRLEFSPTPRPEVTQRLVSTSTWLAGQAKALAV
jgi:monoamine oxidase